MNPIIQNVVSTATLKVNPIDLSLISRKGINIEYNPRRFVAAILRIRSEILIIFLNYFYIFKKIFSTKNDNFNISIREYRLYW
jgi:TATA-box binding protein (TBP) (component of TFIID and TFIIIB)